MYDYSYSTRSFKSLLRKGDFRNIPEKDHDEFRERKASEALSSALSDFGGENPLNQFHLRKKPAYGIKKLADELVLRKLTKNICRISKVSPHNRLQSTRNLLAMLKEGVPYYVARIDIKSFYESFIQDDVLQKLAELRVIPPIQIRHIKILLDYYESLGGTGIPRGIGLSAVLSDFMMWDFDKSLVEDEKIFFYSRYVDDIAIVTDTDISRTKLYSNIKNMLPDGLTLNHKKNSFFAIEERCPPNKKLKSTRTDPLFSIEYLGYRYAVHDPIKSSNAAKTGYRDVVVEIADSKRKKIQARVVRSFMDFIKSKDADLLVDRIKYLTSNFSIVDYKTGIKRISGIYHNYPLLSDNCSSLANLDGFLKNAILSKKGRVFSISSRLLHSGLRRKLLGHSFRDGFSSQRFVHFSPNRIGEIQRCWKYE